MQALEERTEVGFEDALRSIALPLLRFGSFAANAVLFGLPPIMLLVLRPVLSRKGEAGSEARKRIGGRLESLARASLLTALVTTSLFLVIQATVISELRETDIDARSFESVFETAYGRWSLLRYPLLVGLGVLLLGRVRSSLARARGEGGPAPVWWVLWMALSLGLIATSTFSGHAAVSSPRLAAYANDIVHLTSAAIWFCGIVVLAIVLPDAWAVLRGSDELSILAPCVDRFARVAFVTVLIVGISGTINSFFNLQSPADLVDSGYGRAVAGKIALFLAILGLGAVNHYFVRRRLNAAVESGQDEGARRLFRKTIAAELAIALATMALTGFLVGSARTRPSTALPLPEPARAEEFF